MPKGLCTELTVLGRSAILNSGRDATRGGQHLLELRHLFDRHEVILGSGRDEEKLDIIIRTYVLYIS